MADDAVGDEILGLRRDVVQPRGLQRLDADHIQARVALDGLTGDVELARDRRADRVEEPQLLAEPARESHDVNRFPVFVMDVFDDEREVKGSQAGTDPTDDFGVRVFYSQDGLAEAAFGVEYPGEEACRPLFGWRSGPRYERANRLHGREGSRPDRVHGSPVAGSRLKQKSLGRKVKGEQIVARPHERFLVAQGQAKMVP